MNARKIGILAGIVGAVSLVVQFVPGRLLGQWIDSGFQQELPLMFETVGTTVTVYNYLFDIFGLLVTVGLGLGLGYTVGRRIDVATEYRRFVGTVAAGSILSVVLGWGVIWSFFRPGPMDGGTVALMLLVVSEWIVSVSLVVTVGALAGAALAGFRATDGSPARPTDADTPTETSTTDTTTDHDDQHTQPMQ